MSLWKCILVVLSVGAAVGCALTQKPVPIVENIEPQVSESTIQDQSSPAPSVSMQTASLKSAVMPRKLLLTDMVEVAKAVQKNASAAQQYRGDQLSGQAKFVKAAKGNPNAAVADTRITGLGEVSLWCRNTQDAIPSGRITTFEGALTGKVYTSEDFSHDVYLKDCRFH